MRLHANDNFLKAVGYSLDEIKGRHHSMFVDPTYAASVDYRAFWDRLNRGELDAGGRARVRLRRRPGGCGGRALERAARDRAPGALRRAPRRLVGRVRAQSDAAARDERLDHVDFLRGRLRVAHADWRRCHDARRITSNT